MLKNGFFISLLFLLSVASAAKAARFEISIRSKERTESQEDVNERGLPRLKQELAKKFRPQALTEAKGLCDEASGTLGDECLEVLRCKKEFKDFGAKEYYQNHYVITCKILYRAICTTPTDTISERLRMFYLNPVPANATYIQKACQPFGKGDYLDR